ncbi:branched-chain amino acid ABC transporter ATP-binding protein/permease [Paralcaligenes ginsengisoli]
MNIHLKPGMPMLICVAALATLPLWIGNPYQLHIATLIGVYWILVAGLNLAVGYTGVLSIGHIGLLAIGAYAYSILTGRYDLDPWIATLAAAGLGGVCGFLLGLPSLRLPGFYFAMATLAFALMVTEFSLAQADLTGGGVGLSVPPFNAPFASPSGLYWLVAAFAGLVTWLSWNLVRRMWGRAMIALRDSTVAASSAGVPIFRVKLTVFTFSGVTAGLSGALFATLQSYITPETFVFELSLFFFICIVIGGRGTIWGPFLGTIVLAILPEMMGSLARWGQFFYGALLLIVVLLVPEGIGSVIRLLREKFSPRNREKRVVSPDIPRLIAAIRTGRKHTDGMQLEQASKHFGGVVAVNQVSLSLKEGEIHGLIGPNGSGKTTLLNLLSGYYIIDGGSIALDGLPLTRASVQHRAAVGIARTFQKPRLLGTLSGLDNAMLGGWKDTRAGFLQNALALPAARREDDGLRARAREILEAMGLGHIMDQPASLLDHAEQRFLEIARALCMRPRFILLDEPAGGLTEHEIEQLAAIVLAMGHAGLGVLIVEHHTDFVFRICDRVTTLNLGSTIASGSAAEVRANPEVIRVYLGA